MRAIFLKKERIHQKLKFKAIKRQCDNNWSGPLRTTRETLGQRDGGGWQSETQMRGGRGLFWCCGSNRVTHHNPRGATCSNATRFTSLAFEEWRVYWLVHRQSDPAALLFIPMGCSVEVVFNCNPPSLLFFITADFGHQPFLSWFIVHQESKEQMYSKCLEK